jgi:phage gp29-like protein
VVEAEAFDRWRDYPADGLTPSQLVSILRAADEGVVDQAMALYEQMEEKDAHLYAVANKRRLALTGLKWQVVSAAEVRQGVDRSAADEAAAYCRETLNGIDRFGEVLQHLSLAFGRNVAVAENVWEASGDGLRLTEIVPVAFDRLTFDDLGQVRILTKDEPVAGIELEPNKFVVHTPQTVSGHPMRGGLLRVSALAYLGKHFSMKDWMVFAEVFGMPVRIARYEPSATPQEKRELLTMLQSLGSDAAGVFSKAVELEMIDGRQGSSLPPYERLCEFLNREMSKAWLGETLTTDVTGRRGSLAAARVHNEIRLDLRRDDITREGRTLRRDVLGPMTRMEFGPDAPVPFFQRQLHPPRDLRELADVMRIAVNDLGMKVPVRWAHDALGLPEANEKEAVVAAQDST